MRKELAAIGVTNPWQMIQVARNFVRTVWDPTRSDVQDGINRLIYGALRDADAERVGMLGEEIPDLVPLYEEGYDPDIHPDRLSALPDGTLGREYARFIRANGIDPLGTLLSMGPPTNLLAYTFRRAYKLHDLMHVALGCDASVMGEVRIVSYSVGQAGERAIRAPALALSVLFLHLTLRRPDRFMEAIDLAREWQWIGARARPHVAVRLEDHLDRPVPEVRELVLAAA